MNVGLVYLVVWVLRSDGVDVPESPCPRYFDYFRHDVAWRGRLSVPVPRSGLPVVTQVFLGLKAALRSRYVGLIELNVPARTAVDNVLRYGAARINYTVRFPLPFPLPRLTMIRVNNVTICCCGERLFGLVTNIILEHTFPTNPRFLLATAPPPPPQSDARMNFSCGQRKNNVELHQLSKITGDGDWPWLAAILLKDKDGLEFHCTGNLLTDKHVITAAHCVKTEWRHYAPKNYVVYLGRVDLTRWNEDGAQVRHVENIVIHPDYLKKLFTSDLAVLVLAERAVVNDLVRPVCLWRGAPDVRSVAGRLGSVAGWGKTGDRKSFNARPRMFLLPIADQEDCLRSRRDYFYVTSTNTFCAGLRNGTGPCNGDSGSGLLLPLTDDDQQIVWHLRGIISLALLDPFTQTCDLSNYLVFTDVAKFTEWIEDTIDTTY